MNVYGRVYSISVLISNFFLLNLLWIICCLPIITIFPATSAMYGVVRQWILHKDSSVLKPFIHHFKMNFKHSFIIGVIWFFLAAILFLDYFLIKNRNLLILNMAIYLISFLFLLITTFLLPLLVHYQQGIRNLLKQLVIFPLLFLPTSFIIIIMSMIMILAIYLFPLLSIVIFSCFAFCHFFLCLRIFNKINYQMN